MAQRGIPADVDGVLHALMRGTAFRMKVERTLGYLARLRRYDHVIVDVVCL